MITNRTSYQNLILSLLLLITFSSCGQKKEPKVDSQALNKKIREVFKGKTLEESKAILKEQTESLEGLFGMMGVKLSLTVSKPGKIDESDDSDVISYEPYTLIDGKKVEEEMKEIARHNLLNQSIQGKLSTLTSTESNDYDRPEFYEDKLKGEKNTTILEKEDVISKVYFHDKTSQAVQNEQENDEVKINSIKPIDSAIAQLKYSYVTSFKKFVLDKGQPNQKDGKISADLQGIGDENVSFAINAKEKEILAVVGIDAKGRRIKSNSSNTSSFPSEEKQKILKKYNEAIKTWIKNIDKKKYKNNDELISDMINTSPPELSSSVMSENNVVIMSFHFTKNIDKVEIYYASESKEVSLDYTLKNEKVIKNGFLVGLGDKEDESGIVGADGEWMIKPIYKGLTATNANYYSSCIATGTASESCTYYRFDPKNKKMIPFENSSLKGFKLGTALNDNLTTFYNANWSFGLLDNSGKIILNPEYYELNMHGNFILTVRESPKTRYMEYGLRTAEGKVVFSDSERKIEARDGFIFVPQTASGTERFKYAAYDDKTGKSWLPNGIYAGQPYWTEGMLLVVKGNSRYFIDKKQVKKLDLGQYTEQGNFSNGYLRVANKEGLLGLLNVSGKLVLPCLYESVSDVNNNICFVRKETSDGRIAGLVNVTTGKEVHPFISAESGYSISGTGNQVTYQFGDKRYDAFGKELPNK